MSIAVATPPKDEYNKTLFMGTASSGGNKINASNDQTLQERKSLDTIKRKRDGLSGMLKGKIVGVKKRRGGGFDLAGAGSKLQRKRCFRADKHRHHASGRGPLPRHFLLGGNITDPLNLNSMNDDRINMLANAETPVSSPIPTPSHRKQVEVKIPADYSDPLNLNSTDVDPVLLTPSKSSIKRRKKHKRKRTSGGTVDLSAQGDTTEAHESATKCITPLTVKTEESKRSPYVPMRKKLKKIVDLIVSPAIPQNSPKPKRKRTISESSKVLEGTSEAKVRREDDTFKFKKQSSSSGVKSPLKKQKSKNNDDRFIYGNYNRYYGKRNPQEDDKRLETFKKSWFEDKLVLDIGCNIGHITLSIAKDFEPRMITGMDIDGKLISIARKNIKHYASANTIDGKKVPVSLPVCYGPVAATTIPQLNEKSKFPNNVHFVQVRRMFIPVYISLVHVCTITPVKIQYTCRLNYNLCRSNLSTICCF